MIVFQIISMPSFDVGSLYNMALIAIIILIAFLPVPILIFAWWWFSRVKVRLVITKERAGGALKGLWRRARFVRRRGAIPRMKVSRISEHQQLPPANATITLGWKEFALLHQDEAGDLKPYKIWTSSAKLYKLCDLLWKKAGGHYQNFRLLFPRYFIPSLTIDDLDARYFKVMQDRETDKIYQDKWSKYQGLILLGGILIMAVVFIIGTIFMQRVCN